jgi:hypothetical protein
MKYRDIFHFAERNVISIAGPLENRSARAEVWTNALDLTHSRDLYIPG